MNLEDEMDRSIKRRNSGRKMVFHKSLVILEAVWVVDDDKNRGHNFARRITI